MSKTFKSALDSLATLEVEEETYGPGVYLTVSQSTILLAQSDAPALALAILEAAGFTVAKGDFKQDSFEDLMIDASLHLKCAIRSQERATAEAAKEQAELEAEALDFLNVSREAKHLGPLGNFDEHTKEAWLAVARKAREMAKEATNGR